MSGFTSTYAQTTADNIKPLIAEAKRAYGSQPPGSPARLASEQLNAHLLVFTEKGGSLPELAVLLDGELSLSGLRRRIRLARATEKAEDDGKVQVVGRVSRKRGTKDPEIVARAVEEITYARRYGGKLYGDAVRKWYDEGVSLQAIADQIGVSYYSLWSARRTSW